MRAVWLTEFGGPEVLIEGDAPDPVPGPGQVVVDVVYVNVTFVDTQRRAGGIWPVTAEPPLIPGTGVGGVVTAIGPTTDEDLVGRQVICATGSSGSYAERVAVAADDVFEVPDGLGLDSAVALLTDGRTAVLYVHFAEVGEGDRVLVEAAAGGLGSLVVQRAKAAGAQVVAAAGGARKLEMARELGADWTVDYREPGWADRVRDAASGVDVVFDGVGGDIARSAFELLLPGGRFVSYGLAGGAWADISPDEAAKQGVTLLRAHGSTPEQMRAYTITALEEAAAGRLRPVIGQRFPLARAADAHRAIESRATVGKTLLEVR